MRIEFLLVIALLSGQAMANCTVGEYQGVKIFAGGLIQVPSVLLDEGFVTTNASTVVEYSGDNAGGVRQGTTMIRVKCDEKTHFIIGLASADPSPTTTNQWVNAEETQYLGISAGETIGLLENT